MNAIEKKVITTFRSLVSRIAPVHDMILFGSRARGDADQFSDMDIMVIIDDHLTDAIRDSISDCAWEAGFHAGIVVMPVVFSKEEYTHGPSRFSLVVQAAETDGIHV